MTSYTYIIAHEVTHSFKTKKKSKIMGVKLDMAEAYDKMEWDFIRDTIGFFGFHEKFNLVVKECISSISFSILLNGFPSGKIIPTRGLKQGDSLSPYLFILGEEDPFAS